MTKPYPSVRKKLPRNNQDLLYSGFSLIKSSLLRDLGPGYSPDTLRERGGASRDAGEAACSPGPQFFALPAELPSDPKAHLPADLPAAKPADLPTGEQIFALLKYFSGRCGSAGEGAAALPEVCSDQPAMRELWRALSRVSDEQNRKPPEDAGNRRARSVLNMAEHFTTGLINDLRVADRRAQEEPEENAPDPDDLQEYEENLYADDSYPRYVFALFQETLRVLESQRTGTPIPEKLPLYAMAPLMW